ncbi:MAG: hypothetical protein F6J97_09740 [Leptolyngbya sp. SIO4C1]|nr:hypothetical protein [Leptolyngbya sp. SIO4C1]
MEQKLRELIGQPGVWLYVQSSNGWFKNVEILEVASETITFRYESESETERKVWEKTTRLDNVAEIEVRLLAVPKATQQLDTIRGQLSRLLEQSDSTASEATDSDCR